MSASTTLRFDPLSESCQSCLCSATQWGYTWVLPAETCMQLTGCTKHICRKAILCQACPSHLYAGGIVAVNGDSCGLMWHHSGVKKC